MAYLHEQRHGEMPAMLIRVSHRLRQRDQARSKSCVSTRMMAYVQELGLYVWSGDHVCEGVEHKVERSRCGILLVANFFAHVTNIHCVACAYQFSTLNEYKKSK